MSGSTKVAAPFEALGDFPIVRADQVRGVAQVVATLADRNALPARLRAPRMLVTVTSDPSLTRAWTYRLLADLVTWEDAQSTTPSEVSAAVSSGVEAAVAPVRQQVADLVALNAPQAFLDELNRPLLNEDGLRILDEPVGSDVSLVAFQALAAQVTTMASLVAALQQQVADLIAGGGVDPTPVDEFVRYVLASSLAVLNTTQAKRASRAYGYTSAGRTIIGNDTARFDKAGNLRLERASLPNLVPNPTMAGFTTSGSGTSGFRALKPSWVSVLDFQPGVEYQGHTGVLVHLVWNNTTGQVQGFNVFPGPTGWAKAALGKNRVWTLGVPVALYDGALPDGCVSFINVFETGEITMAYTGATVQKGGDVAFQEKMTSEVRFYGTPKTIALGGSTNLDGSFNTLFPAGSSGECRIFIAGEWQMCEDRMVGTFPPDGSRAGDELDQVLVQGRQGTIVLDLIKPQREATDVAFVRVSPLSTPSSAIEAIIAAESYSPCARAVTANAEQCRTSLMNNLPKGTVGRFILCWEDGWLACASEGIAVEWRDMVLPPGMNGACTLTLPGFQGSVVGATYYSRAMKAADLRRLSVSGAALPAPDAITPRDGVSGLGGGVRVQDNPNRSPHLMQPPAGWNLNDLNGPFVWRNSDGTVRYHFGFQLHHAIARPNFVIPDNGVMWAHMEGPDCVRLRYRGVWIRPGWGVPDNNDSSSGSAVVNGPNSPAWEEQGVVRAYWTGQGNLMSATSRDAGATWEHDNRNLLSAASPPAVSAGVSMPSLTGRPATETRDPAVRDRPGTPERHLCQGARVAADGPSLFMFRFSDQLALAYVGRPVLLVPGQHLPASLSKSDMLECADFGLEPLSGKMVFMYSRVNSFTLVGTYNWDTAAFTEQSNQQIDAGRSYAAKLWYDRDGRLCYQTWISDPGAADFNFLNRMNGTIGAPMRLSVGADNFLSQEFHPDWATLRQPWRSVTPANAAMATFVSQSLGGKITGTGDIAIDFSDGGTLALSLRYSRSANQVTLAGGPNVAAFSAGSTSVKPCSFGATEAVTVEFYRTGSRYLFLMKGADGVASRERMISAVALLAVPNTPADEFMPMGTPGVAFPTGAALSAIQVADVDFASPDRFNNQTP